MKLNKLSALTAAECRALTGEDLAKYISALIDCGSYLFYGSDLFVVNLLLIIAPFVYWGFRFGTFFNQ